MSEAKYYYETVADSHYDAAQQAAAEVLLAVPGLDPVRAAFRGEGDSVPTVGYLISAQVDFELDQTYVQTHLYRAGVNLILSGDGLSQYGYWDATAQVNPTGRVEMIYAKRGGIGGDYNAGGQFGMQDACVSRLADERVLLTEAMPLPGVGSYYYRAPSTQHLSHYGTRVNVCRVAASSAEAADLLRGIGRGLLLHETDLPTYDVVVDAALEDMQQRTGQPTALGNLAVSEVAH